MPTLTVAIPAHNAERSIAHTLRALAAQRSDDFEVLVVDDGSRDGTAAVARSHGATVVATANGPRGAAAARNTAIAAFSTPLIAFTDADCEPDPGWVPAILDHFDDPDATDALAGETRVARGTDLGDAIASLGWPGGGLAGFAKMWPVDEDGRTRSMSSCNCAFRRRVFDTVPGYDESFPGAAGEDTLFVHRLNECGIPIRFRPDALVIHESRSDLGGFLRWQYRRGRSAFFVKERVGRIGSYVRLRFWSMFNVLGLSVSQGRAFLVWPLWAAQMTAYLLGYASALIERKRTGQGGGGV